LSDRNPNDIENLLSQLARSPQQSEEHAVAAGTARQLEESPTLSALGEKRRPDPMPVCGACPHSMWFASAQELKCYCRKMHVVTWNNDEPIAITACDGILLPE
jgi:hypothetical protein